MSSKLTYAITCVLAGTSGSVAGAATPSSDSSNGTGTDTLQEVVVTAQRRAENIQDVPISIQAFTCTDAAAAQHRDIRRLHQVPAERDEREQRTRPE